jgi:hypothetical protein
MSAREVVRTTDEPARTDVEREVVTTRDTTSGGVLAARVVWYITGVIIALLALRLILQLLGANEGNPFVDLVYGLSGIFAAPFFGMFSYEPSYGVSYFEVSTFVAILIYALLGWGIARLFTLNRRSAEV